VARIPTAKDIEAVAREVLREMTGRSAPAPSPAAHGGSARPSPGRQLIDQAEVRAARSRGEKSIVVPASAIVTPLARDLAWDLGIQLQEGGGDAPRSAPVASADGAGPAPRQEGGVIALGSDHGGFAYKARIKRHLEQGGLRVADLGTHDTDSCDYPDFAAAVAKAVSLGEVSWGILVDGAGIGSCMAANKVPGVLAATCHDERTAGNSREHNGANVLCLGSKSMDERTCLRVVDAWLDTPFGGGRHGKRVDKIKAIERSFVR
jgi:ribose 5-phosphate isomerase B